MIRGIRTRLRRLMPSRQAELFTPGRAPQVIGAPAVKCGASMRRGRTRTPLGMVRLQNRAASKRARAARRVNRNV